MGTLRALPTDVAMSSFGQSGLSTTQVTNQMVGEKVKTVTVQGPYNAQQTGSSVATTDVIEVWADYGVHDYTTNTFVDPNSTNFKDPI